MSMQNPHPIQPPISDVSSFIRGSAKPLPLTSDASNAPTGQNSTQYKHPLQRRSSTSRLYFNACNPEKPSREWYLDRRL